MDKKDEKRRQLIQAMLAPPGDATAAERHLVPWRALTVHLSPLIGDSGFSALYGRTGRLLAAQFGWLTLTPSSQPVDALFQTLVDDLAKAGPTQAALANEALLATFTRLLDDLIGAALTTRLIDTAWSSAQLAAQSPEHAGSRSK